MMEFLERLSLLCGVSGDEDKIADAILQKIEGHYDECHRDALGNLLVFKRGQKRSSKKVLLAAHMDEVGFIITQIDDTGRLRFATVGGIDSRVILGKPVLVGDDKIYGIIGAKAVHLLEKDENDKVLGPDDLTIDIGAQNREQALQWVQPGARAVFDSDFVPFGDGFVKGRALDDRAGCALLAELIGTELAYDMWFAFTVQEETGTVGAKAAAFAVEPDYSIVVETTTAADIAGVAPEKQVCCLGKGPVLSFMDKGTVYDHALYCRAWKLAQEKAIPAQTKQGVYGGNDARSIQSARGGVRCLAVSMPCRYLHSPACVLKKSDILATKDLVKALAEELAALD